IVIDENKSSKQMRQISAINTKEQQVQNVNVQEMHAHKIKYELCPICNENFSPITLVIGNCRWCYSEKILSKKFTSENDMDPGEVLQELQGLTEIEEMLIAQVFPVIMVYKLCGGQYSYHENIINFLQDVQEFTMHLSRSPSSLNVLIIYHQSVRSTSFRDF
ncbi:41832_t:CDS:2, partial [Gigaspora margarita]